MEKEFSALFNKLCEDSDKNNSELAELLDADKATIGRWRTGERSPKLSKLPEIAKLFNVDIKIFAESVNDKIKVRLPRPEAIRTIAIYGDICCGNGLFVDDLIEDYISIPVSILPNKHKEYFAQYVRGDSMEGAGLYEGDLIIFEKTQIISNGEIGCFCVDDNIATCKKYSQTSDSEIYLLPANDKYSPIRIDINTSCFRIIGKKVLKLGKE